MTWHATIIALFLLLFAGGVGLPVPEDLTLLTAGALAQPTRLRLADVVIAGFAGGVTADWILYGSEYPVRVSYRLRNRPLA